MMLRCATVVLASLDLVASRLQAQFVAQVGVRSHVATSRSIAVAVGLEPDQVGAAQFVIIGVLAGAGAVTAFWVHAAVVSAR